MADMSAEFHVRLSPTCIYVYKHGDKAAVDVHNRPDHDALRDTYYTAWKSIGIFYIYAGKLFFGGARAVAAGGGTAFQTTSTNY